MDVRDRSTYGPSQENLGIERPSRLRDEGHVGPSVGGMGPARDSSEVSPAAQVVAQAVQMPEIRLDRVAALQQQIASGNYQVAPQEVADAMLRNIAG